VVSGREQMVGAPGRVLAVGTDSWAEVHGERWKIRSAEPLLPGQAVRVLAIDGLTLQVRTEPRPDEPERKGT
jgi:membrane-bound serine protease (ClpP class)